MDENPYIDDDILGDPLPNGRFDWVRTFIYRARPLGYVLLLVAACWAYILAANMFINAPFGIFLSWVGITAAAGFVFKVRGFHIAALSGLTVFMYFPMQLVFINSRVIFLIVLGICLLLGTRQYKKNTPWPRLGYACVILWIAGVFFSEALGPKFVGADVRHSTAVKGIRKLDGVAQIAGKNERVDLRKQRTRSLLLSRNGLRLYSSYDHPDTAGLAATDLDGSGRILFRRLGKGGVTLFDTDPDSGDILAGDNTQGVLYRIAYQDLHIKKKYTLAGEALPSAVVDNLGNQMIVPDTRANAVRVFNMNKTDKPWFTLPSGSFKDRLFPVLEKQKLPGLWSVSRMVYDPLLRRVFITYSVSRNLLLMGLDDHRLMHIGRDQYPGVADAALDTAHLQLYLANIFGFVEYYDTAQLRPVRRVMIGGSVRALDYDALRDMIVAADHSRGDVVFIDRASGAVVKKQFVCLRITDLEVSPVTGNVYLSCETGLYEVDPKALGVPDDFGAKKRNAPCCGD